jgi:hypothetical protein
MPQSSLTPAEMQVACRVVALETASNINEMMLVSIRLWRAQRPFA